MEMSGELEGWAVQAVRLGAPRGSVVCGCVTRPPEQEPPPLPGAPQWPATPTSPSAASASRRLTLGPLCAPLRAAERLRGLREGAPCGVGAWHSGAERRVCAEGGLRTCYALGCCEGLVQRTL
eukprot:COSAG04_NODE_21280_length_376_cov_1.119134_1_plen_123_part_01